MTEFSIRDLQTLDGIESIAFKCSLCVNNKVIATVSNAGTGGDNNYVFTNPVVEREFRSEVTDDLIWELLDEKLLPRKIPASVFQCRIQVEQELASIVEAIAQELGTGWEISPGIGGTTRIGHESGCCFECFLASGINYADLTHRLCVMMRSSTVASLTEEEKQQWEIPEFDLKTDSPEDIVRVLRAKFSWLTNILPDFQEREKQEASQIESIRSCGKELANKLGLTFEEECYKGSFSIKKEEEVRGGESLSITVNPHCYSNKSSIVVSANRISDEKLSQFIKWCEQLEI